MVTTPARQRPYRDPLTAVALTMAAALLLSGCASPRAGAAATVGATRITEAELAAATSELRSAVGGDPTGEPAQTVRTVLARMVTRELAAVAVERAGIRVPTGAVDRERRNLLTELGGQEALNAYAAEAGVPARLIDDVLYTTLALQQLGVSLAPAANEAAQQDAALLALADLSLDLGVEVNPRYGVWLPANGAVGPPPDDLSIPAGAR